MLRSKTRWQVDSVNDEQVQRLSKELDIHPSIARLLVRRGIAEPEAARHFLSPSLTDLHDPFLLDGMEQAVGRIRRAIERQEKIWVYGDYDADGVSSTSLMMKLFRHLQAHVDYYIPNRFREGYGLNKDALQQAADQGVQLIVTVDTGISAVEEAAFAKSLGLDLIITDHHEPPPTLPEALAILNPKKPGCPYPFDMLAGVGVAFKLATALLGRIPEEWLEIVALGTIADLVPLVDENRVIASLGLKRMNQREHVGITALLEVSGIDGEVTAGHVGFSLGPRINASGRLDSANLAVELMLSDHWEEARRMAEELNIMNRERQQLVDQITQEAIEQVENNPEQHRYVIVVAKEGWNVGVIGIVASRLVEKYYRPAIVLGIDEETGMAKGSARSIVGFDMYQALTHCQEFLEHFGGHVMAAGMALKKENIPSFHQKCSLLASEWLTDEDYIPITTVDDELKLEEITVSFVDKLQALEPYGIGNPTPHFVVRDARISRMQRMGVDRNHLRLQLNVDGRTLDVVGFRQAELAEEIAENARVSILGELQMNEWNGKRSPQLILRDLMIPHLQIFDWRSNRSRKEYVSKLKDRNCLFICQKRWNEIPDGRELLWDEIKTDGWEEKVKSAPYFALVDPPPSMERFQQFFAQIQHAERLYFVYGDTDFEDLLVKMPTRDHFKQLYKLLLSKKSIHSVRHLPALSRVMGLSKRSLSFIISVFEELKFINIQQGNIVVVPNPVKQPLENSQLYQKQLAKEEVFQKLVYSSYRELCDYLFAFVQSSWQIGGTDNGFQRKDQSHSGFSAAGHSF
ncbi:single-stranded-DNA-specific exonuclease RecJ [Thermoflavimicrobium dichotomicum]|uniref:Single-stranded-DNA-specific exonuclease RecJ n=1 Tax=Thermoflavimicrobium dichotomicum TaxID=46223 RepID=A0A1I3R660_9BACL|nr:single-stranded-DNA-specific exonuclease RecJ [Thermoflavimicrobium dichotomicum]SFJ40837.1 single-stranded-DNA-specific exonuclease [Thermoflavimicrobium dichotomicum]